MTQPRTYHTRALHAKQKRAQQAKPRRRQQERERLQREQARAQRALQALEQALGDLGLSTLAEERQWQLHAQHKLLGTIVGVMVPPAVWLPQLP